VVMVAILGSIYLGIATPTEAAGVGCTAILIIAIAAYGLRLKGLYRAVTESAMLNAMLMFIMVGASFFSYVIGSSALAEQLTGLVTTLEIYPILVIIGIQIILLILGCFIDGITIMLLTVPIFVPLIMALGFSPLWFGILYVVNMEIALITPPMGINLFLARNAFNVQTGELLRGILPFMIALVIFLFILVAFPDVSLWLPGMMIRGS